MTVEEIEETLDKLLPGVATSSCTDPKCACTQQGGKR